MEEKMLDRFKFPDELKEKTGDACGLSKSSSQRAIQAVWIT